MTRLDAILIIREVLVDSGKFGRKAALRWATKIFNALNEEGKGAA